MGPPKVRVPKVEISMTASRKRFTQEFKDELSRDVITTFKPLKDVTTA